MNGIVRKVSRSRWFRRALVLFALLFLPLLPCGLVSFANGPVPRFEFDITVKNAPEGSYGVDFLVPRARISEEEYTECNSKALGEAGLPEDCELVQYGEEGYVSYMAHDSAAWFDGELRPWNKDCVSYGMQSAYSFITGFSDEVKIAVFDAEGHVLAVSDGFRAYPSTGRHFYGDVVFDVEQQDVEAPAPKEGETKAKKPSGGTVQVEVPDQKDRGFTDHVIEVILAAFFLLVIAVVTMLLELLIALLFRLKPVWWVLGVNLCTNLVFNVLLLFFCYVRRPPVPYFRFVLIGEIIVVLVEYFAYTKLYTEYRKRRLFFYSVFANLFSALAVMIFTFASRS